MYGRGRVETAPAATLEERISSVERAAAAEGEPEPEARAYRSFAEKARHFLGAADAPVLSAGEAEPSAPAQVQAQGREGLGRPQAASPAERVLSRVLAENPAVEPALAAVFDAPGRESLRDGDWKGELARVLEPFLRNRAAREETSYEDYMARLGGDAAARERADFARLLVKQAGHRTDGDTYFFRDHPLWKGPLEEYLAKRVAERRAARTLTVQSVGTGSGAEAYGLAIMVDRALRAAGEDPSRWEVGILTYDVSLKSLLLAGRGLFALTPKDEPVFKEVGAERYFEPRGAGLRLAAPLRSWIKPVYADLDQADQHPIVLKPRADVVFVNYLLHLLRLTPAAALADHWLSGTWSDHGFLSMAQLLVAEVGASPRAPAAIGASKPLVQRMRERVGVVGWSYFGDGFESLAGFAQSLNNWMLGWRAPARAASRLGAELERGLRADPFKAFEADPRVADYLESLRARGVTATLTTETLPLAFIARRREVFVNVGWVLAGPLAGERLELLKQEVERGLRGMEGAVPELNVPRPPQPFEHPDLGKGEATLFGHTLEGAALRLGRFGGHAAVFWLTRRLTPISDAYRGENVALKEQPKRPARSSGGWAVKM